MIDRAKTTVAIGRVHGRQIEPEFTRCFGQMLQWEAFLFPGRLVGDFDQFASGAHVATGRCGIVRDFLKSPYKPEWLLLLDSDATFAPDVVHDLLEQADPVKAPIVGGLAFGMGPALDAQGKAMINKVGASPMVLYPTLYRFTPEGMTLRFTSYPKDTMVQVDGTGGHCLIIHRSVLEDERWDHRHPNPWFRSGTVIDHGGEDKIGEVSEDMFFCIKARAMGYPIFVNTAVKTGHVRSIVVDEDMFDEQQKSATKVKGLGGQRLTAEKLAFIRLGHNRVNSAVDLIGKWKKNPEDSEIILCLDHDDPNLDQYPIGDKIHTITGPRGWDHTGLMVMAARKAEVKTIANVPTTYSFMKGWSERRDDRVMTPQQVLDRFDIRRRRAVLIPSRNPEKCRKIVTQLVEQGGYDSLIIAWNGSNRDFEEWLVAQPRVQLMLCDAENGIHPMWNYAITAEIESDSDLVFLNDDVELGPDFIEKLVDGLYSYPRIAATCPNYDGRQMNGSLIVQEICAGRYDGTGGFSGFAFALSREWLKETGYIFPEACKFWYGDNDVLISIYRSGWAAVMLDTVTCVHDEDGSAWMTPEMQAIVEEDQKAFLARWPELRLQSAQ